MRYLNIVIETSVIGLIAAYKQYVTIPRTLIGWQYFGFTLINSDPKPATVVASKYSKYACCNQNSRV